MLNQIRLGLRCNKAERKAWKEQKFPQLCPIIWSDPFGWVVIMERAIPMSNAEFDAWYSSFDWPHVAFADSPFETTGKDAGTLRDGRKVMIDYGMLGY